MIKTNKNTYSVQVPIDSHKDIVQQALSKGEKVEFVIADPYHYYLANWHLEIPEEMLLSFLKQ